MNTCEALASFNRLRQARRLARMLGHVSVIADVAWHDIELLVH